MRILMGRESRRYAEERYDVHKVNAVMMREMGMGKDCSRQTADGRLLRARE